MPVIKSTSPSSFKQLTDTPSDYSGNGDSFVQVKTTEDGLTFTPISSLASNVTISNVDCYADVYIGSVVRMDTSGVALNAIADSLDNSNMIGVVVSKESTTICTIRVTGVTGDLYAGLDPTKEYYLSDVTPGLLVTTIPTDSGHVVLKIGQPFSSTSLMVSKGQRTVRI